MLPIIRAHLLVLMNLLLTTNGALGQGTFQNLDFESAASVSVPDDSLNRIYFDAAFPAWIGYVGGVQQDRVFYDGRFLCCSSIGLFGPGVSANPQIEGSFSAALFASPRFDGQPADAMLTQTGVVPVGSRSLLFKAQTAGPFAVSLGGQSLSLIPLSTSADYIYFGADITSLAGQTSELRFTAIAGTDPMRDGSYLMLDAIAFSPMAVPEPSILALFALAGALGWFCWRRKAA